MHANEPLLIAAVVAVAFERCPGLAGTALSRPHKARAARQPARSRCATEPVRDSECRGCFELCRDGRAER
eukprot:COSAG06_NODE_43083_length_375_cov_1.025362_1_plen_69_part_10